MADNDRELKEQAIRNYQDCRAALHMIRTVVEAHAPPNVMEAEEMLPPDPGEADEITKGILAIVHKRNAAEIIQRLHVSEINGAVSWLTT